MRIRVNRRPGLVNRRFSRKPGGNAPVTPSISSLGASSGERWFANTTMTVSGSGLGTGATVNFGSTNNIPATYSAGTLTFTCPESELWATGSKNVSVKYNGVTTNTLTFTVNQPTSLVQDLRADRGVTLNGSTVSAWASNDGSGDTNRNVSQANASLQPTYRSSDTDFNGRPSVKFVRANTTKLVSGAFNTGTWTQTTIAAVLKSVQSGAGAWWMFDGLVSTDRSFGGEYYSYPSVSNGFFSYRTIEAYSGKSTTTPSAVFCQYEGTIGGAATQRAFARSASTGGSVTSGTNNGQTGVTLGDRYAPYTVNNSGPFDGAIAEYLVFNTPLTQDQRTRLGNYFSNLYGECVMNPASISSLGAASGERWFASTAMTITGDNLGTGATVNFGSTTGISTTYTAGSGTSGTLSFTCPESELWETGTRSVTVTYNGLKTNALTFTVTQPTALIQDLRADRGITLNGSTVSSWSSYDTSGDANRVVSQATAAMQPTYRSSDADFNGLPSVKFVRANGTKLVSGTFNTGTWAQTTIAAVVRSVEVTNNGYFLSDGLLSTDRTFVGSYANISSVTGTFMYRGGPAETISAVRINVPSVFFAQFEGSISGATTERLLVRSASTATIATKGTNNGQTGVTIGDRYAPFISGGNGSFDGAVAEWIMFNAPLTQDQRTRIGNYFSARYGSAVMTP